VPGVEIDTLRVQPSGCFHDIKYAVAQLGQIPHHKRIEFLRHDRGL
jgi:hypothetical protein